MKNIKFGNVAVFAACLAILGAAAVAGAQSIHHDRMDARAARADIARLKADRRMAKRNHDWKKVAQDNRLIRADQKFVRKDVRKVIRATG